MTHQTTTLPVSLIGSFASNLILLRSCSEIALVRAPVSIRSSSVSFSVDFEKLTLDGLNDTGALTSAISEQDLNKIKLLENEAIKETGHPPNFQIMVANGKLEVPIGTVLLEFEVVVFMLKENFIIMKNLPNPLIGLCFLRRNNAVFDVNQGIIAFPNLSMQLKRDT